MKRNICGVLIDDLDMNEALNLILANAKNRQSCSVTALAVHGVVEGMRNEHFRSLLNHCDLVLADGQPVRWALNAVHSARMKDRVAGPKLMENLCAEAAENAIPVYFYGSTNDTLDALINNLRTRYEKLEIAGYSSSRFRNLSVSELSEVAEEIRASGAALCFVGLGCPRQEKFVVAARDEVGVPIIAVGAAFDFSAGLLDMPSEWIQRAGLQWLHRMLQEPRRLWKRYTSTIPFYCFAVLAQLLRLWRPSIVEKAPDGLNSIPG